MGLEDWGYKKEIVMLIPIMMITMIFGITPFFTLSQEAPLAMTEDQIMQSKEYQDFMEAQKAFSEFTGDTSSAEYKTLEEDFRQKQEAFYSLIPADQPAEEDIQQDNSSGPKENEEKTTTEEKRETPSTQSPESAQEETSPEDQDVSSKKDTPSATQDAPKETALDQEKREIREATPQEPSSVSEETPVVPIEPSLEAQEALIPEESLSEEPVGIDTMSLENPQGNWLFKRIWWERAEERYERIRLLVDAIWEQRNEFFKQRNQLDRNILDPFYMNIGIGRGELQTILSEITDFLEQQREQQDELSEQERGLYETYITEEETLKQLKLDVDMITNLDQAIDEALGTFMNQINRVKNYESEAWKNFKEIAHILNDTRARELYYMIEGAARNIKTISIYLEQEFFTHFHKLIEDTKTRVARVQSQMDALKEKGVLFQKQAEQLEQEQITDEDQEDEDEQEEAKPKPKLGWIDWIMSGASDVFSYIWSIIRMPYDMIFGK